MPAITTTSLKAIFRFPFSGPEWQTRLLIGVAIYLANFAVPLAPAILIQGYMLRVMRQSIEGQEPHLPPWDDWGKMMLDGLQVILARSAYLLPGILVLLGGMFLYFAASFVLPFFLPLAAASAEAAHLPNDWESSFVLIFFLAFSGSLIIFFLSLALGWLLLALGAIPLPAATAHLAAQAQLGAAFRIREWGRLLWANKLGYFVAWIVALGFSWLLTMAVSICYYTIILWFVLPIIVIAAGLYVSLINAALFGQTYRESVEIVSATQPQ